MSKSEGATRKLVSQESKISILLQTKALLISNSISRMYKFISTPLQYHLNGPSALRAQVSGAVRLTGREDIAILRLPTQRRSAVTLEALMSAGLRMFEESRVIKINELCDLAGIGVGAFYSYFRDAEHFLNYLHYLHIQDCEQGLIAIAESSLSLPEKIEEGSLYVYEAHSECRELHRWFRQEIESVEFVDRLVGRMTDKVFEAFPNQQIQSKELSESLRYVKSYVEDDAFYAHGSQHLLNQLLKKYI